MVNSYLIPLIGIIIAIFTGQIDAADSEASQNVGDSTANVIRGHGVNLNDKISKIENHNLNQDKEIARLNTKLDEERKINWDLRSRVTHLEGTFDILNDQNHSFERIKRPVRLLPYRILLGEDSKDQAKEDNHDARFYGPATGCEELGRLGYTLNGFYVVKAKKDSPSNGGRNSNIEIVECRFQRKIIGGKPVGPIEENRFGIAGITENNSTRMTSHSPTKGMPASCKDLQQIGHSLNGFYSIKKSLPNIRGEKIETVFCNFGINPSDSNGFETRIGTVDLKSSLVHFHVHRKEGGIIGKRMEFHKLLLNVGGGFDWKNQLFRAPYNGTYSFAISGSKDFDENNHKASVFLKHNTFVIGEALSSAKTSFGGFSLQVTMILKANDIIDLELTKGKVYFVHFTDSMLDEDINIF